MPRAVLLDLFDTLVVSDWDRWRAVTAELLGVDPRVVDDAYRATRPLRNRGGYPDLETETRAVIEAVGIEDPPLDLVRSVASAQHAFMTTEIALEPEVVDVATALRDRGATTVLVSNCSFTARPLVETLGLDRLLDGLILSFEVRAVKPDARIYELALEAAGAAPAEAVFVDDQVAFCDGARALGIDTRLLLRPHAAPPEGVSPTTNGHEVIEDLRPLLA
jgi:HAD superfamily hydrolase (TIGR01509 family)